MTIKELDSSKIYYTGLLGNCKPKSGDFNYRFFKVSRQRLMNLWGKVYDERTNTEHEVKCHRIPMRVHCLKIEKMKGVEVVDTIEVLCGLSGYSPNRAMSVVIEDLTSNNPVQFCQIEELLELHGYPNHKEFDSKVERLCRSKIGRKSRYDNLVPYKKNFYNDVVKSVKVEYLKDSK